MTGWRGDHYVVTSAGKSSSPTGTYLRSWKAEDGVTWKSAMSTVCPVSGAASCDRCAMPGCADPGAGAREVATNTTTGRHFPSGAYRDTIAGKLDYEGFLAPAVLERYAQYMDKHRLQSDGTGRDSDNWQAGMPKAVYIKSGLRHVMDWWKEHRGAESRDGVEDALCGVIFNAMGYLLEVLRERGPTNE